MKKCLVFVLTVLFIVSVAACSKSEPAPAPEVKAPTPSPAAPAAAPAPKAAAPEAAAPAVVDRFYEKEIVYGTADGVELKMDIAKPIGDGPFPAVVCIHGGGWQIGKRQDFEPTARIMAMNGYVAATVDYRMTPAHKWPAQIEDVKCAVRYLRAHAEQLKINPDKIGALGHSAGAHLALMLGLTDPKDNFEGNGGYADQSSKVQAVVNLSAPTNLSTWKPLPVVDEPLQKEYGKSFDDILADLLGTADRAAQAMADASPVTYADESDSPVLTFHGSVDPLVPPDQAKELDEALKNAGVPHKLIIIEGADHGFKENQLPNIIMETTSFFGVHLKGEAPAAAPATEEAPASTPETDEAPASAPESGEAPAPQS